MGAAVKFSASSAAANLPFKEQFGALVDFIKKFLPFAQPSEMKPEPLERVTVSVKKKEPLSFAVICLSFSVERPPLLVMQCRGSLFFLLVRLF